MNSMAVLFVETSFRHETFSVRTIRNHIVRFLSSRQRFTSEHAFARAMEADFDEDDEEEV